MKYKKSINAPLNSTFNRKLSLENFYNRQKVKKNVRKETYPLNITSITNSPHSLPHRTDLYPIVNQILVTLEVEELRNI